MERSWGAGEVLAQTHERRQQAPACRARKERAPRQQPACRLARPRTCRRGRSVAACGRSAVAARLRLDAGSCPRGAGGALGEVDVLEDALQEVVGDLWLWWRGGGREGEGKCKGGGSDESKGHQVAGVDSAKRRRAANKAPGSLQHSQHISLQRNLQQQALPHSRAARASLWSVMGRMLKATTSWLRPKDDTWPCTRTYMFGRHSARRCRSCSLSAARQAGGQVGVRGMAAT